MQKKIIIILLMVCGLNQLHTISFGGYDISRQEHAELKHMLRAILQVPAIMSADSNHSNTLFLSSLLAASSNGFRLTQELLHRPQTPVWKQMCCNFPIVFLSLGHLLFDGSRMANASSIADHNKSSEKGHDTKINQMFCVGVELVLRWCAWKAHNHETDGQKNLAVTLSAAANMVEQWRLASRWLTLKSGLPMDKIRKILPWIEEHNPFGSGKKSTACKRYDEQLFI